MNALRQEAFRMMETMPDEGMAEMIRYMTEYKRKLAEREQRILANRRALPPRNFARTRRKGLCMSRIRLMHSPFLCSYASLSSDSVILPGRTGAQSLPMRLKRAGASSLMWVYVFPS